MHQFDFTLGDAGFAVTVNSKYQDCFNTPTNIQHFHIDKEIHIVLAGDSTVEVNGKSISVRTGDVFIVPENVSHYYKDYSDDFTKISLLFTLSKKRTSKKGFSEFAYYTKTFSTVGECVILRDKSLAELGNKLLSLEYSDATYHIRQILYALLIVSISKLLEKEQPTQQKRLLQDARSYRDSRWQKKIIEDFFFKRYNSRVTIKDLAREICKSVPQTHRIVKNYFGDNFKTVLIKQRMEQACILINQGEKTLAEIAYTCGYNSYNGFLSAFKGYTGKTPELYRNSRE